MLERALQIEGLTKQSELALLHRVAQGMPHGALVVEVGSYRGRSTVAIAEGLARVDRARLVAIDPFTGDPGVADEPTADDARMRFDRNTAGIAFLETMQMTSLDAVDRFEDSTIDWIFIDGLHDYRNVYDDIRAWGPKMKAGALMSGHDYGRAGVTDAVLGQFADVSAEHSIWMTTERPHLRVRGWMRAQARRALRRSLA